MAAIAPTSNHPQGVGTKLLKAAAQYGRAVGAIRMTLSTALDNENAQALYAAEGWERDGAFCTYHKKL